MDTQQNRKNEWPRLVRNFIMMAALLLAALPAKAEDYVLAYVNGGTTYYLARNGTSGVQRVTSFNPTTCIWSCSSAQDGNTPGTLHNSNTYGYLFQTVGGTKYFLGAADNDFSLATNVPTNYYRWRTNGTYVYNRFGNRTSYYINLANATPERNTTANTTSNARPYTFTISDIETASTNPTINGADLLTATGNSTYTATGASYSAGYTNYRFNNTNHYVYDNAAITPAAATLTNSWSLPSNTYATVNNAGVVTVSSLPESDITLTLTVTVAVTGGTPAAPGGTTLTATKEITIQGTTPAEPTITRTGNTVSIATTSAGATIYYTTDGSTPTAASTPYTGPFDLTTSPTTVKAIAIRDSHGSTVASETLQMQLAAPVITISNTGLATITAEAGATIHYTTDGTTPTTSSPTYSAPVQLTNPQTIMAIAVKANYTTSSVAMDDYITGGVSGGKVILDDREDHTWTYYAGVDAGIDGGNYNTNYLGKLYSPNPRNVKIVYQANGGAVSIDESETEFVYYKTLEQGATAGQYPYTVISNPFSKRPNGKGFGGWRIKEGADYINGYADEAVLPLDADIVIANLPYPTVNCLSAEIVLEATWVNLNNITYANNNTITYNVSGGNYETNILVLNRNVTGTITTTSPVTIMMVEPDGSSDYRGTYSFTGNITPNNTGVTKIEFTRWNSTNTLNCNNHSVTVGRGMTTTSQCASYVTGVTGRTSNYGATTYNTNLNYHLKLESGTFTDVAFIAGTEGTAGYVNCNGTSNQVKGTLGNDYDRAKGDNTKLAVTDELFLGYRPTYASGNQNNANFTCWVKSGNLCSGTNVTNTTFNGSGAPSGGYYGDASQTFYVSVGGTQTNIGKRKLYVEGGILAGIAGGIDENNPAGEESFFVRMTGGQVRGIVYGSGAFAASSGIRRFVITGGTINGWVAAGCNGTDPTQSGGTLPSDTYVYIGGTSHIGNTTDLTLNTSSDGNVFGAGSGNSAQATTGRVNNSNVVIADQCYVKKNVYGGGNYGYSNAIATVYVTGGQVANSVFGGSNQKQGVTVNVNMTGGQVDNGVYGGSNASGTISGNVTMTVNGGTVGDGTDGDGIFGGGYGASTIVTGNVSVTLGTSTTATDSATVNGNVYGGSALGRTNNGSATNTTTVTMNKALINGNLFGGALGSSANVNGRITVNVNGGRVNGNVFGGGDAAPYSPGGNYPVVNMTGGQATNVFGGGKGSTAVVTGNPQVILSGTAHVTGNVYGGGDAAEVSGHTNVELRD